MDKAAKKSLIRRIRRDFGLLPRTRWGECYTKAAFELGRRASSLLPVWMESDEPRFDVFLSQQGLPYQRAVRVADMALTYHEIPSLNIWLKLNYPQIVRIAELGREGQTDAILRYGNGLTALDLMAMVR